MSRRYIRTPRRGGANSAPPQRTPPQPQRPPSQPQPHEMPEPQINYSTLIANMQQQSRQLYIVNRRLRKLKVRYYNLKRLLKEFAENVAATLSSDDEEWTASLRFSFRFLFLIFVFIMQIFISK